MKRVWIKDPGKFAIALALAMDPETGIIISLRDPETVIRWDKLGFSYQAAWFSLRKLYQNIKMYTTQR